MIVLNDTYFVQRLAHQERNMHAELEGRHLGNSQSVLPRQYPRHMKLPSDTLNINKRIICIYFRKAQSKVSKMFIWVDESWFSVYSEMLLFALEVQGLENVMPPLGWYWH